LKFQVLASRCIQRDFMLSVTIPTKRLKGHPRSNWAIYILKKIYTQLFRNYCTTPSLLPHDTPIVWKDEHHHVLQMLKYIVLRNATLIYPDLNKRCGLTEATGLYATRYHNNTKIVDIYPYIFQDVRVVLSNVIIPQWNDKLLH